MKGQPIRPMVTLDFRDVEKRLGECKEIAWSVDGKRVAPASQQYSADEPHKRTVQSLSFIFSVDALASMISAETKADVCGESFMMDAYAAKALELFGWRNCASQTVRASEDQMQEFTIAQIEKAVNAWREAEGVQNHKLGLMTRTVADVYGRMIFDRATVIGVTKLTAEERGAVERILA
jgi:hypothetical protein